MRRYLTTCAFVVASLAGCTDDRIPSCVELGGPKDPSGAPDHWEPCGPDPADGCWCAVDLGDGREVALRCEVEP